MILLNREYYKDTSNLDRYRWYSSILLTFGYSKEDFCQLVGVCNHDIMAAILIASFPIGTTINTKAAAVSNNNNTNSSNSKSNAICFDRDAADETYYVGYVDAINDFHHIKRYGITAFFNLQAEADYHRGYQDGWADAKVNGTTIDSECWDTRVGN
jgi:hypothetical protein